MVFLGVGHGRVGRLSCLENTHLAVVLGSRDLEVGLELYIQEQILCSGGPGRGRVLETGREHVGTSFPASR